MASACRRAASRRRSSGSRTMLLRVREHQPDHDVERHGELTSIVDAVTYPSPPSPPLPAPGLPDRRRPEPEHPLEPQPDREPGTGSTGAPKCFSSPSQPAPGAGTVALALDQRLLLQPPVRLDPDEHGLLALLPHRRRLQRGPEPQAERPGDLHLAQPVRPAADTDELRQRRPTTRTRRRRARPCRCTRRRSRRSSAPRAA